MPKKRRSKNHNPKPKPGKMKTPGLADLATNLTTGARNKPLSTPSAEEAEQAKADREALGRAFPSVKIL